MLFRVKIRLFLLRSGSGFSRIRVHIFLDLDPGKSKFQGLDPEKMYFSFQVIREQDYQALLSYLTSSASAPTGAAAAPIVLCPAQLDKDFTGEREQELDTILTRVNQAEERAVLTTWPPLRQEEEVAAVSCRELFQVMPMVRYGILY